MNHFSICGERDQPLNCLTGELFSFSPFSIIRPVLSSTGNIEHLVSAHLRLAFLRRNILIIKSNHDWICLTELFLTGLILPGRQSNNAGKSGNNDTAVILDSALHRNYCLTPPPRPVSARWTNKTSFVLSAVSCFLS